MLCVFVLIGCGARHAVEDAEAVVKAHEEYAKASNLEGVLSNAADDLVTLIPGMPLLKGKDAFGNFYAGMLAIGKWEFVHEFDGAEVVGDAVILHGIAKGTLTKPDSAVVPIANNFMMVLKYAPDGKMKFWRVTFAASLQ